MVCSGLYDNLGLAEILHEIKSSLEEQSQLPLSQSQSQLQSQLNSLAQQPPISHPENENYQSRAHDNVMGAVANRLVHKAREESLNRHKESPFSLLAKENDILWGYGGRPDDTSVIAMRVVDKNKSMMPRAGS